MNESRLLRYRTCSRDGSRSGRLSVATGYCDCSDFGSSDDDQPGYNAFIYDKRDDLERI